MPQPLAVRVCWCASCGRYSTTAVARIEVLRGINLDLQPGALVSVVGASGVGKSTLLHLLGTLDVPTSGAISVRRGERHALSPAKLAYFRNRQSASCSSFTISCPSSPRWKTS